MTNSNTPSVFRDFQKPVRAVSFFLLLIILLEFLSVLSLISTRNPDPVSNCTPWTIFNEPDHTIDVVVIGNSNVRSGIIPLQLWKDYGITGYAWGEPGVDPFDSEQTLKKIFRHQAPSLVVLEASFFFRNSTTAENLNSMVRANAASALPILTYHRHLTKMFQYGFSALYQADHSVTKGYFLNFQEKSGKKGSSYMKETSSSQKVLHPLVEKEVLKIRQLCEDHGAQLLISAIPSTSDWGYAQHQLTSDFCEKNQLDFLDMNLSEAIHDMKLDWKKDTRDKGTHMNYYGASLVTAYLGKYLDENYSLKDHRQDNSYARWNEDCSTFYETVLLQETLP